MQDVVCGDQEEAKVIGCRYWRGCKPEFPESRGSQWWLRYLGKRKASAYYDWSQGYGNWYDRGQETPSSSITEWGGTKSKVNLPLVAIRGRFLYSLNILCAIFEVKATSLVRWNLSRRHMTIFITYVFELLENFRNSGASITIWRLNSGKVGKSKTRGGEFLKE